MIMNIIKLLGYLLIILLMMPVVACTKNGDKHFMVKSLNTDLAGKNHLSEEKSPYLLQHKDNPVWWYSWGEEAFKAAKEQDKPIFLSIGYSTCHWCHVMEEQVFEHADAAEYLNKHFISIKVDREELPDVDMIYMDALHAMGQRGGWPMTVVMTPDLKPFFGGTYFPKIQFLSIMSQIAHAWENERDKITNASQEMYQVLQTRNALDLGHVTLSDDIFKKTFSLTENQYDSTHGGFGGAPKFPPSMRLKVLLRIYRRSGNQKALEMVENTLDKMARGGMYDHLGGGFHRYSTDEKWLVPHFEKMLYDNANLVPAYLEAYQITKKSMYAEVARETLDYVLRVMTSPEGGFYSAEDADSEGEEGKFYVWKQDELKNLLSPEEFKKVKDAYGVSNFGNFENQTTILNLQDQFDWQIKNDPILKQAFQKLFAVREKRIHPLKDTKIMTSWNGLMIAALTEGYQVLQDKRYLDAAQKAGRFINKYLYRDDKLLRRYRDGQAKYDGTLDDYAFLIHGLLALYQSDFDPKWLEWAENLQHVQNEILWDAKSGGYFYTDPDVKHLLIRIKDLTDSALPNGNGMSALNLLQLYSLTFKEEYKNKSVKIFQVTGENLERFPPAFAQQLIALDYYLDSSKEVAIIGEREDSKSKAILSLLYQSFYPNIVIAFSNENESDRVPILKGKTKKDGQTTVYICEEFICQAPTTELETIKKTLKEIASYKIN